MTPLWITQAAYAGEYRIALTFSDGVCKTVDLLPHLYGEVFEPLRNVEAFQQFRISAWSVQWSSGADISPEFLYYLPNTL